jgi:hypothetical protein
LKVKGKSETLAATLMDSYQFYKSLYDRELNRRIDLDSAINLPLTILSIIVAANSYIVKESSFVINSNRNSIQTSLLILIVIGVGVSIFYLTRSYNNFFKGFAYRNLGLSTGIRKYESTDLVNYNKQVEEKDRINFEIVLIDKLTQITDNHIIFNDKRSRDLYLAKTILIISTLLTSINFILFLLKYFKI